MKLCIKFWMAISILAACSSSAYAVEFSLYGDLSGASNNKDSGSFSINALDLSAKEEVSESTVVTAEILFEPEHHSFAANIERLTITRSFGDLLNLTAGKMLKPLGLWNHNFNHASISQDTVTRPFFLEFEGRSEGVFLSHLIGINLNGETDSWTYQLAFGNSTGMDTCASAQESFRLRTINTADSGQDNKTWVLRGTYRPGRGPIEVGFMSMKASVTEMGECNNGGTGSSYVNNGEILFEQAVLGIDFNVSTKHFYALAEYYYMSFEDNQGMLKPQADPYETTAYYLQLGYHVTDKLTAAIRYASLDFEVAENTYFGSRSIVPEIRNVFALTYRLEESNAIRLEANTSEFKGSGTKDTNYIVQWFFLLL